MLRNSARDARSPDRRLGRRGGQRKKTYSHTTKASHLEGAVSEAAARKTVAAAEHEGCDPAPRARPNRHPASEGKTNAWLPSGLDAALERRPSRKSGPQSRTTSQPDKLRSSSRIKTRTDPDGWAYNMNSNKYSPLAACMPHGDWPPSKSCRITRTRPGPQQEDQHENRKRRSTAETPKN